MNTPAGPSSLSRRSFLAAAAAGATLPSTLLSQQPEDAAATAAACLARIRRGERVPVLLDTDLGNDVDDLWALQYLLNAPELDLKLVTVSPGASRERAALAAKFLTVRGREDVPIGIGPEPGGRTNQHAYVADYDLQTYAGRVYDDAAAAITEVLNGSDSPVTVCTTGPCDNVADALRGDPWLAGKARFVGTQGSIHSGYSGRPPASADYNVSASPAAFRTVLEAEWEPTIAPLDTSTALVLRGDRYDRVRESDAVGMPEVLRNYELWLPHAEWLKDKTIIDRQSSTLFDIAAVTLCFDEQWMQVEDVPLEVEDGGMTVVNPTDGRPVRCALRWRDLEGYLDHVVERLTAAG